MLLVSLVAVFWMSRNAAPKGGGGGALHDIQKKAARETKMLHTTVLKDKRQFVVLGPKIYTMANIPTVLNCDLNYKSLFRQ